MSEDGRIRGKVVAVLSRRELVLNLGSDDGVLIGTKFVILNSQGVDVTDPDTNQLLGTVEVPKTVVKVVRIDGDHICVARTFRTVPGSPGILSMTTAMSGRPARLETLDIASGSSLKAELSEEESYIKRGDVAVETKGDEYDDL